MEPSPRCGGGWARPTPAAVDLVQVRYGFVPTSWIHFRLRAGEIDEQLDEMAALVATCSPRPTATRCCTPTSRTCGCCAAADSSCSATRTPAGRPAAGPASATSPEPRWTPAVSLIDIRRVSHSERPPALSSARIDPHGRSAHSEPWQHRRGSSTRPGVGRGRSGAGGDRGVVRHGARPRASVGGPGPVAGGRPRRVRRGRGDRVDALRRHQRGTGRRGGRRRPPARAAGRAVVVAAGLGPPDGTGDQILSVNLRGSALLFDAFSDQVVGGSVVVGFASVAMFVASTDPAVLAVLDEPLSEDLPGRLRAVGLDVDDTVAAYSSSKRGVSRLCKRWANAWGRRGGRCVAIAPGLIDTPMGQRELDRDGGSRELRDTLGPRSRRAPRGDQLGDRLRLLARRVLPHRHHPRGRRRQRPRAVSRPRSGPASSGSTIHPTASRSSPWTTPRTGTRCASP